MKSAEDARAAFWQEFYNTCHALEHTPTSEVRALRDLTRKHAADNPVANPTHRLMVEVLDHVLQTRSA